ncbi:type I-G CRISPR-associated protein Cas8g1/Csx17 [Actinomadura fibrosa]|uniref:Type I-U CRISPR-associated protein Csx17 n=1 Tax=Actinomadura fibrosa TaxID=111802 RepID=A0ABW2Y7J9_9ACTN|nr:type I-U CRISPR-associated protein Csx17 [Actinomadura fibrosa]
MSTSPTTAHRLAGLRADTLGGYLSALGLLRVLSEQADPGAHLHWDGDVGCLSTSLSVDELVEWLVDRYRPSPIVSPWNAGSGFAGNGKSITAEKALHVFRAAPGDRFAALRAAIQAADQVVAEARERGWQGGALWAEQHKADVVRLCRARLPDEALPWLDVAVTLTSSDLRFSPLAGTGGNFGRQDLSATFLQRLALVAGPQADRAASVAWAHAVLLGREDVPYVRDTVGQYDPGRAGGILSSPREKSDDSGFANPWSLVLTLEGTLLFASAVTRRNRAAAEDGALPFLTRSSAVGYDTAATGEDVKGEQWVPLWPRPAGRAEVEHLLGEGRAQWNGRQARAGMDFALAVASLGVDRGLSAFRRFVITTRLGQNPLAVPVGRLAVEPHGEVDVLREPYAWLLRLKRLRLPGGVASAVRRTEQQIYQVAAGGGAAALRRFVVEFGRLHAAVSHSGAVRADIRPYAPGAGRVAEDWPALLPEDPELWIAAAIASLRDSPADQAGGDRSPRGLLTCVQRRRAPTGRWETVWSDRTPTRLELTGVTLAAALGQMHRLRALPPDTGPGQSSGRATGFIAYRRGVALPEPLVQAFVLGDVDDHAIADYLNGLLVLGCRPDTAATWPAVPWRPPHPLLSALLPFLAPGPIRLPGANGPDHTPGNTVDLAPRPYWAAQLLAGNLQAVAEDARRRLTIASCRPLLTGQDLTRMPIDGTRLAGALLLHLTPRARTNALAAVTAAAPTHDEQDEEVRS